jgi:RNA polymerase sigma factor (sigma-70 family)
MLWTSALLRFGERSPLSITTPPLAGGSTAPLSDEIDDVFRHIYLEHSQGVYGTAWPICGAHMANEVTQEVFLDFWRFPDKFDPAKGTLHALLVTMARHKAIDSLRSETARRRRERRMDAAATVPSEVDARLLDDEAGHQISRALDQLPRRERDAIVTAYFGQCTYKEAALVLGQPEGTTKARIHSGLARMRVSLASLN